MSLTRKYRRGKHFRNHPPIVPEPQEDATDSREDHQVQASTIDYLSDMYDLMEAIDKTMRELVDTNHQIAQTLDKMLVTLTKTADMIYTR